MVAEHGKDLGRLAVILPGQRAGAVLRKYLAKRIGEAFWSPEWLDMGTFMERIAHVRQGKRSDLLLMMYRAHRTLAGERAEPLDAFLQWAPVVLRDMSDVDMHLVDLDDLYRDLREMEILDSWSTELGEQLSAGQQRLLGHWQDTGRLHRLMHTLMEERALGSSGWVARQAALHMAGTELPWETVWCVGANALEPATTVVLRQIRSMGRLQVAWDADHYYLDDPDQEAGRFLRRSIGSLGQGCIPPTNDLLERPRSIRSVIVPERFAQAQFAAQILQEMDPDQRGDTTVVLADEELLMPLLSVMPGDSGPINITAGIPLSRLPVHGLVENFLDLHAAFHGSGHLELNGLLGFLSHPFLAALTQGTARFNQLTRSERRSMPKDEVIGVLASENAMTMVALIRDLEHPQLHAALMALFGHLAEGILQDPLALEQIYRAAAIHEQLYASLSQEGILFPDHTTERSVYRRLAGDERLGYFGDPEQGVQVMGFLETRALSRSRLIVLGANDGILPQASQQQSFIPFDIRRAYGLPLRADSEAISAYHTYRMLQSATSCTMVSDAGGSADPGEPSRFIAQWEHELVPRSRTSVERVLLALSSTERPQARIAIQRSNAIQQHVLKWAQRGISPSALGVWLRCPLDLYFSYVLGIKAPEDRSDKLGSDVLGSAVHEVFQSFTEPHLNSALTPAILRSWVPEVRDSLLRILTKQTLYSELEQGHSRLRIDMATKAVQDHLEQEAIRLEQHPSLIPIAVETQLSAVLPNGVRLTGRCDRIDLRNDIVHILDLKTGSVLDNTLKVKGLERSSFGEDHGYALQLLAYAWAYLTMYPNCTSLRTGVIPLQRASRSEGIHLSIHGNDLISRAQYADLTALFVDLTNDLVYSDLPFTHSPTSMYCTCCVV